MCGRQANRAGNVGAYRHEARAGGDRCAGAGRRAAGIPGEAPWIARDAVQRADAGRHQAAIGHRGLGEDHRACLAKGDGRAAKS